MLYRATKRNSAGRFEWLQVAPSLICWLIVCQLPTCKQTAGDKSLCESPSQLLAGGKLKQCHCNLLNKTTSKLIYAFRLVYLKAFLLSETTKTSSDAFQVNRQAFSIFSRGPLICCKPKTKKEPFASLL